MTKSYDEIFNEAKRKVNANIKNTGSKKISYETILEQASTKRTVTERDVNKINNFFASANKYIESFNNDVESLKWNNTSNIYTKNR